MSSRPSLSSRVPDALQRATCCAEPRPTMQHAPLPHGPRLSGASLRAASRPAHELGTTEKGRSVSQAAFPVLRRLHIPSGDFGTSRPGAYLPIESWSAAAAFRDSRELWPEPNAMVSHLRKMGALSRMARTAATFAQTPSPLFPLSTAGVRRMRVHPTERSRLMADGKPSQASRADNRRWPSAACRWPASSPRADRPLPCR